MVHHLIVRGIERRRIFRDQGDYQDLLERLDGILPESQVSCLGWVLMPNHIHLVVRRETVSISRVMARINTGYAMAFNRRYRRCGHLFQNRFLSTHVETTESLLQLIRYVHLNPLRAGLVGDLRGLAAFPWCGHGALAGSTQPRGFHSVERALEIFGHRPADARRRLNEWMSAGLETDGEIPELEERYKRSTVNGEARAVAGDSSSSGDGQRYRKWTSLEELLNWAGDEFEIAGSSLRWPSKRRVIARARAVFCCLASRELGMSGREISRALGGTDSSVSRAIARGAEILKGEVDPESQNARNVPVTNRIAKRKERPCDEPNRKTQGTSL